VKIKSAIMTSGAGSIGGVTLSHNRGGMYLKARSNKVNRSTATQVASRSRLAQLAVEWQNLTDPQRAGWNQYATNVPVNDNDGDPLFLTGQQHFIRTNGVIPATHFDAVFKQNAPKIFNLGDTGQIEITAASGVTSNVVFRVNSDVPWLADPNLWIATQLSLPTNQGARTRSSRFRLCNFRNASTIGLGTWIANPSNATPPFRISTGQRVHAIVRILQNDGRLSSPIRLSHTVP